jgi:hypothetical protein
MPAEYWYYYFSDKKSRNQFLLDIDGDAELVTAGIRTVTIANEVMLSNGSLGFVVVLSSQKSRVVPGKDYRDRVGDYFEKYEGHMETTEEHSPYDY